MEREEPQPAAVHVVVSGRLWGPRGCALAFVGRTWLGAGVCGAHMVVRGRPWGARSCALASWECTWLYMGVRGAHVVVRGRL